MSDVEQDRKRALRLLLAIPDSTDRVSTVAQALADERDRTRAPFLALAAEMDATPTMGNDGIRLGRLADRIRAEAEDPQ